MLVGWMVDCLEGKAVGAFKGLSVFNSLVEGDIVSMLLAFIGCIGGLGASRGLGGLLVTCVSFGDG
jgi:hypothetical protein